MNADIRNARFKPARIEVTRLSTLDEIRQFSGTWETLLDRDAHASLFQSPQMFFAWQQAAEEPEEPWFLVARIDGEAVGCAPLVLKSWIARRLRCRSIAFGSPRGDFIISRERAEVAAAFVGYLRDRAREWDLMVLDDVSTGSGTMQTMLGTLGADRGYRWRGPESAPSEAYLDASGTWDEYLGAKGRHFRHSLRYQCKRIERLGSVAYRRYQNQEEAHTAFDAFVAMEATSWKSTSGSRLSPRERECFRSLVRDTSGQIAYDILFLEVDRQPVAGLLSFLHRHRYYLFVTFYDERVRDLYPGRPLFREALRDAFARENIREISFVGSYPYAMSWCDQIREYQKARIYGTGLRARLAGALDRFRNRSAEKTVDVPEHA